MWTERRRRRRQPNANTIRVNVCRRNSRTDV